MKQPFVREILLTRFHWLSEFMITMHTILGSDWGQNMDMHLTVRYKVRDGPKLL